MNLFTDWEVHGFKQGTNNTFKTPGKTFTDEWGIGQILPLKKNLSQLLQVDVSVNVNERGRAYGSPSSFLYNVAQSGVVIGTWTSK